jgi:hypothetical protein
VLAVNAAVALLVRRFASRARHPRFHSMNQKMR